MYFISGIEAREIVIRTVEFTLIHLDIQLSITSPTGRSKIVISYISDDFHEGLIFSAIYFFVAGGAQITTTPRPSTIHKSVVTSSTRTARTIIGPSVWNAITSPGGFAFDVVFLYARVAVRGSPSTDITAFTFSAWNQVIILIRERFSA